jgi:MerR family transcriptional regulator, light-induced transcriptional regulator
MADRSNAQLSRRQGDHIRQAAAARPSRTKDAGVPPRFEQAQAGHKLYHCGDIAKTAHVQPCQSPEPMELVRTIESEVIPRLLLALKGADVNAAPPAVEALVPGPDQVRRLASLVVAADDYVGLHYVERLHVCGMPLETIYLELLAPAARHLGEQWFEDTCDFSDVTVGLSRLQSIVRKFSPNFRSRGEDLRKRGATLSRFERRRALIAPVPGEQHTLGAVMIEDFFSRAGWDVSGWPLCSESDLVEQVRSEYYQIVGLSVSCESRLGPLEQQISAIRRASRNRTVMILVGGRVFVEDPKRARAVGADTTGATGREAVMAAESVMTQRAG